MNEIEEKKWERLVIVTAIHGEKYLGYLPEDVDPRTYMEEKATKGLPIELQWVRNVISQVQPNVGPRGELMGMGRVLLLMPVDMWIKPVPTMFMVPSSWYFPIDADESKNRLETMIRHALDNEAQLSASEAGLVTPGTAPFGRGH